MKKLKKGQRAIRVTVNSTKTLFELNKIKPGDVPDFSFLTKVQNALYEMCCSVDEYANYYIEEHELTILLIKYGDMLVVHERNYYEG